jgi:hypothetical protein
MSDTNNPVFEFIESAADLLVYPDFVMLKPKGLGGFLTKGLKGEKRISISSIVAVQLKEAGFTTGYLQFTIAGGNESRAGALDAVYDENSFLFGGLMDGGNEQKNLKAKEIREFIENYSKKDAANTPAPPALAEQIQSLKDLLDAGALTEDEFAAAKAKLLS